jgi:hypothetical protein
MSVPLDRLYNFLHSVCDHDLIIYGWRPHGSKNLKNLTLWNLLSNNWRTTKTQMTLIFHDQEPLDYDFSQACVEQEFCIVVENLKKSQLLSIIDTQLLDLPELQQFYKKLHLKSVLNPTFYDLTLLVHSEKNSHQVEKYKQNNFVPVYYWSHVVIAQDWFRFAEHDPNLKIKSAFPKTFLVYNRAWSGTREYRLKFAEQLIAANLHHKCITSFAKFDNQVHYRDHVFSNSAFAIKNENLEKILPENTHDSNASADYNNCDYQNSLIEVVLETLFDDTRNHLTEKSLRPIACGQPFILVSTPGSLQYLRSYGFQTFEGYIDETYDTIQDPVERLNAIVQEMKRIDQLGSEAKQQLLSDIQAVVDHNQRLFFSKEFYNLIIDEFKQNLDQAVIEVKSGPVGNIWTQLKNIEQDSCPELVLKYDHQTADDHVWAEQWIQSHVKS